MNFFFRPKLTKFKIYLFRKLDDENLTEIEDKERKKVDLKKYFCSSKDDIKQCVCSRQCLAKVAKRTNEKHADHHIFYICFFCHLISSS